MISYVAVQGSKIPVGAQVVVLRLDEWERVVERLRTLESVTQCECSECFLKLLARMLGKEG